MSVDAPGAATVPAPVAASLRHLVWLFAPPAQRQPVAALLAIEAEVAHSLRSGVDHAVAHARIDWWSGECLRLARGQPTHPYARRLLAGMLEAGASPPDLGGLVEAARIDLATVAFDTEADFAEYLHGWSCAVFRSLVQLGASGLQSAGAAERFATQAGAALREIELLGTLAADAWRGRVHVPIGADPQAPERWRAQPWPAPCAQQVAARVDAARAALAEAASGLAPQALRGLRAALVWCALGARRARRIVAALPREHVAARHDPLADTFCAWRTALAADRGRLPSSLRKPA